jgi:hypothetical protein
MFVNATQPAFWAFLRIHFRRVDCRVCALPLVPVAKREIA